VNSILSIHSTRAGETKVGGDKSELTIALDCFYANRRERQFLRLLSLKLLLLQVQIPLAYLLLLLISERRIEFWNEWSR
jgi:hypothetical protein